MTQSGTESPGTVVVVIPMPVVLTVLVVRPHQLFIVPTCADVQVSSNG